MLLTASHLTSQNYFPIKCSWSYLPQWWWWELSDRVYVGLLSKPYNIMPVLYIIVFLSNPLLNFLSINSFYNILQQLGLNYVWSNICRGGTCYLPKHHLPSENSLIKFLFIFGQNLPPQYSSLLHCASGITLTHSKPCLGCRDKRAKEADSDLPSWTWSWRDKGQVNL